ncbi:pheromone a factor receptor, partial [Kalaharituber pfeilii]
TLSGISIAASILPLLWHLKTRNLPAIFLIAWIMLMNLCNFINAFIWGGSNVFTTWDGRVFCDIQVKLIIAASAGKMGAAAAVTRNLANIMRDDLPVTQTRTAKRRALIQDLALCLTVPVWMMAVHYFVQPDRYWLVGVTGCTPSVDNSWPSIVLVFVWPLIIALVATFYCSLVFIRIRRYRREFEQILTNASSQTTASRFYRLYAYCTLLILVVLPTSIYIFYRNLKVPKIPYDWDAIHDPYEWSYIYRVSSDGKAAFDRWIPVGAGILLFFFFGVGHDAVVMYRGWMRRTGLEEYW